MNSNNNLESSYVKSYYDNFLASYDKQYSFYRWDSSPVARLHYSQTKRTLKPYLDAISGSVLEVGGGDGIWTREYVNHIQHLTFLDISKEMISRAQQELRVHVSKINYVNDDFLNNTFTSQSFDTVVSIRNLEYFTDKKKFISEVVRLLNNGGKFILVTKSPVYNMRDNAKNKKLHTAQIGIKDLLCLMRSEGLTIVSVRPAIFGKLFRFLPTRIVSSLLHKFLLVIPWRVLPLGLLSYISESFMIYAKK